MLQMLLRDRDLPVTTVLDMTALSALSTVQSTSTSTAFTAMAAASCHGQSAAAASCHGQSAAAASTVTLLPKYISELCIPCCML